MALHLERIPLIVVIALLSAGCAGTTDDAPLDAAVDEPAGGDPGPAPGDGGDGTDGGSGSGGSGGTEPSPEQPGAAEEEESAPAGEPDAAPAPAEAPLSVTDLAFNGTTGTGLWTCRALPDGTRPCQGTGRIGGATTYDPEFDGAVLTYHVEARWVAQSPLTEQLRLTLEVCDQTECQQMVAEGASPLTLQGSMTGEWGNPRLSMGGAVTTLPDGSFASVEREQAFALTGSLVGKARGPDAPGFAGHDGAEADDGIT